MGNKLSALIAFVAAFVAAYVVLFSSGAAAQGIYTSGTTGVDVSYPNCSTSIPKNSFGVVGVTAGLFYSYNGCLAAEASHFKNLSLYTNTGWYDQSSHIDATTPLPCAAGDANCLAYNYGYNAAKDAVNYAQSKGVSSATWWLDVENSNSWSGDVVQNQNSLQGSHDALQQLAGAATVGVYSTTAQWQEITGGWQNHWPNWGATTWNTVKQAAKYCSGHAFTGGPTYLIQYSGRNIDLDYAC
jgi:hypothetical protein